MYKKFDRLKYTGICFCHQLRLYVGRCDKNLKQIIEKNINIHCQFLARNAYSLPSFKSYRPNRECDHSLNFCLKIPVWCVQGSRQQLRCKNRSRWN